MRKLVLAALFLFAGAAQAACTGSGVAWSCTAGSSTANVESAIASASDEAVITFAAGTYTWTSDNVTLSSSKGMTFICETKGACDVSYGSAGVFYLDYIPSNITKLIRISGFDFSGDPGTAAIWIYGSANIEKLRIDNNSFTGQSGGTITILLGETSSEGAVFGVIDNNTVTGTNNWMFVKALTSTGWVTGLQGSANNLFIEDNTISFTNNSDLGTGAFDAWLPTSVVFRYNSVTNGRLVNHSLCHGGPVSVEIYNNTITSPSGSPAQYRNIHLQGSGEAIIYNNTVSGTTGGHIAIQHYRSDSSQMPQGDCTAAEVCDGDWTAASGTPMGDGNRPGENGYPCWRQPGRDESANLKPVYLFGNYNAGGTRVDVSIESGGLIDSHFVSNRDYYQQGASFDGTSGVGSGTLASRPSTCTTGAESGGGVAYWATDEKKLYRCSATNTWTLHYQPYTYPHPLRGASKLPGPANLRWRPADAWRFWFALWDKQWRLH